MLGPPPLHFNTVTSPLSAGNFLVNPAISPQQYPRSASENPWFVLCWTLGLKSMEDQRKFV